MASLGGHFFLKHAFGYNVYPAPNFSHRDHLFWMMTLQFAPDENLGDKPGAPNDSVLLNTLKTINVSFLYISLCKDWIRCHLFMKISLSFFIPLHEKKMLLANMSQIYKKRRSKGLFTWGWRNPGR